jgi:TonB family protein
MRIALSMGLMVLALPAAAQTVQTASAADVPMRPKGAWIAEFEESMCVLSRGYGEGEQAVRLAFKPVPGDQYLEIALVMPHTGKDHYRSGEAEAALLPSGQHSTGSYLDYTIGSGQRVVRFMVKRDEIADLNSAKSIRLTAGKEPPRHFALVNTANAMKTIQLCQDDLMRVWGYDPEVLRTLAEPAEPLGSPQYWVTNDDYPKAALEHNFQGSVRFRLTVDTDGKVSDCQINQSSGVSLLDQHTCALLRSRARFKPAVDVDGKPVRVPWNSTFTYRLPN